MVFAPVTANSLGKMAHGIADNFLVTAYLSAKCPVFIAPAMDLDMYLHPSTQGNIAILRTFGNYIIEPQVGELASGLSGPGRLEEPEAILSIVGEYFSRGLDLKKKKILITAGPTYEKIDPVRFIGNYSTGKMGFSLAYEAARRGADVTLVAGPVNLSTNHPGIRRIDVESADEMRQVCLREAPLANIVIMAAAVADYTCSDTSSTKLKKSHNSLILSLTPTQDIIKEIGANKGENQLIVGFALETDHELEHAKNKLISKNLDLIVLNSLKEEGAGFGLDSNKITILDRTGVVHQGKLSSKPVVAAEIIDFIVKNRTIQP
jgi:phosphopantothenoylcysteine decarboxylase / phosphopantothenate---cysteine ligase